MKYITSILCLLFILAGCSNIMAPQADNNDARTLTISVSDGDAGARTLYPKAFTKYVLYFSGAAANGLQPVTLEDGRTSTQINASSLGTGELIITAKGYTKINNIEYEAAEGSATITIGSGNLPSPVIKLNAGMTAGVDGWFTYSANFPSSMVSSAELTIRPYYMLGMGSGNGQSYDVYNNNPATVQLAPGYYYVSLRLYNDFQAAGVTEIVHIYSNMETEAKYNFTENDFAKYITVSGTIDVKIDGQVPLGVVLDVFLDENYRNFITEIRVDTSDKTWSMKLPAFEDETPLYFAIWAGNNNGWFNKEIGMGARVKDQDKSGIVLPSVNINVITISGTVNIQTNGATLQNAYVQVFDDASYNNYLGDADVNLTNGNWSFATQPFNSNTTLYFRVVAWIGNDWYSKETTATVTVKGQSISGVNLGTVTFSVLTISGTVNVTVNGEVPQEAYIQVFNDASYSYWNQIGNANVNLIDGTWSWTIREPFDDYTTLYFRVRAYTESGYFYKDLDKTVTVKDQGESGVNLGSVTFNPITISGTVYVTVNGVVPQDAYVEVCRENEWGGWDQIGNSAQVNLNYGTWSWTTEPFDSYTTLYFRVRAYTENGSLTKDFSDKSETVKDQSVTVNLGNVNFSAITISGTVTIQVNGATLQEAYVEVYESNGSYNFSNYLGRANVNLTNGTWSWTTASFDSNKTLYFRIGAYIGNGSFNKDTDESVTVKDQSIGNINLGTVSLITISGTVNIKVNGATPQEAWVYMYDDANYNNYLGNAYINLKNGTWSWATEPFDSTKTLYFRVGAYTVNGILTKDLDNTVTVKDQNISGVNLGTVTFSD